MSRVVTHQLVNPRNGHVLIRRTCSSRDFWSPFDPFDGGMFDSYRDDLTIQTSDGGIGDNWNWKPAVVVVRNGAVLVTTSDVYET